VSFPRVVSGHGAEGPDGVLSGVGLAAVRGVTVPGRPRGTDQPRPLHLRHSNPRRHQGRDPGRRAVQSPGKHMQHPLLCLRPTAHMQVGSRCVSFAFQPLSRGPNISFALDAIQTLVRRLININQRALCRSRSPSVHMRANRAESA
jgi:hypothetical protein